MMIFGTRSFIEINFMGGLVGTLILMTAHRADNDDFE